MDLTALIPLATASPDASQALQDRATALINMALDEAEDMLATGPPDLKAQIVKALIVGVARTPKDDASNTLAMQALQEMNQTILAQLTPASVIAGAGIPEEDEVDAGAGVVAVDGAIEEPSQAQLSIAASIAAREEREALEQAETDESGDIRDLPPTLEPTAPRRRKAREPGRTRTGSPRRDANKLNP